MSEDAYKSRVVSEETPVKAWGCCSADKRTLSEQRPGQPIELIDGWLPPQVMPWPSLISPAVGYFNLWGEVTERQPPVSHTPGLKPLPNWGAERNLYSAQFGYPDYVWVFDRELAEPLKEAFDIDPVVRRNRNVPLSPARSVFHVRVAEWVDLIFLPGWGYPPGALTEDVGAGWEPAKALHVQWRRLWALRRDHPRSRSRLEMWLDLVPFIPLAAWLLRWPAYSRSPNIVRRVKWDDDAPLDPDHVLYKLKGVTDIGRMGHRPVLVYEPSPREGGAIEASKFISKLR